MSLFLPHICRKTFVIIVFVPPKKQPDALQLHVLPVLRKQAARTAGVDKQYVVLRAERPLSGPLHKTRKGFAGVAGIQYDAL